MEIATPALSSSISAMNGASEAVCTSVLSMAKPRFRVRAGSSMRLSMPVMVTSPALSVPSAAMVSSALALSR